MRKTGKDSRVDCNVTWMQNTGKRDRNMKSLETEKKKKKKKTGRKGIRDLSKPLIELISRPTMLFQLLDTIAVVCWTTIRPIFEQKISRFVTKTFRETENEEETFLCDKK